MRRRNRKERRKGSEKGGKLEHRWKKNQLEGYERDN